MFTDYTGFKSKVCTMVSGDDLFVYNLNRIVLTMVTIVRLVGRLRMSLVSTAISEFESLSLIVFCLFVSFKLSSCICVHRCASFNVSKIGICLPRGGRDTSSYKLNATASPPPLRPPVFFSCVLLSPPRSGCFLFCFCLLFKRLRRLSFSFPCVS